MKDDEKSLRQRLASTIAGPAQRLLKQFRRTPEQTDIPPAEGEHLQDSNRESFSGELFAELLIELPDTQQKLSHAHRNGDLQALGNHVHRLLGAIAYCDTPELETALRKLRRAIIENNADNTDNIDTCYIRVRQFIDSTLEDSGCPDS